MRALVTGAALLLLAGACGGNGNSPGPTSGPSDDTPSPTLTVAASPEQATTLYGVAGLIPPHWPNPTDADWTTLFGQFGETGTLLGVYQGYETAAQSVEVAFTIAATDDLVPVVGIGAQVDAAGGGATLSLDPADAGQRQGFIDTVVGLVQEHEVSYLLLGTEVDRIEADDPAAFDAFVALYADTYDAVKAVSPETKVFTAFQLEELRGSGYLTGRDWEERWDLIDAFGDRLDLVGFTSYPFFDYESPADIPDDYYAEAMAHTGGRPIAFTELGWPSAPLSSAPDSGYGGNEEEQAAFIQRFGELTDGLDVALVLWAFPNDVGDSVNPSFASISLRTNAGEAKPALEAWQTLAGVD